MCQKYFSPKLDILLVSHAFANPCVCCDGQVLQKDISRHREAMVALDKMGTHLKYFSQKQDVILIKNLLSSVQHRWEKIVSRSAERTRHLERGYKEAKQVSAAHFRRLSAVDPSHHFIRLHRSLSHCHQIV